MIAEEPTRALTAEDVGHPIIERARGMGYRLGTDGTKVQIQSAGTMPPALRREIADHKPAVIAALLKERLDGSPHNGSAVDWLLQFEPERMGDPRYIAAESKYEDLLHTYELRCDEWRKLEART